MASDAWIAPDGKIHPVDDYGHCAKARELGDETGGVMLEMGGYIHCSLGRIMFYGRINRAQINALFDFVDEWERQSMTSDAKARAIRYRENFHQIIQEYDA